MEPIQPDPIPIRCRKVRSELSYARFSEDSSVYVFLSVTGHLECCSCALRGDRENFRADSTDEMIVHLKAHKDVGHKVPQECMGRLMAAREANDAYMKDTTPQSAAERRPSSEAATERTF